MRQLRRILRLQHEGNSTRDIVRVTPTNYLTPHHALSRGVGNISGAPLFNRMLDTVRKVYQATGGRIGIHARGEISTGAQAFDAIAAGASSVDLYTAFIYRGWRTPRRVALELLEIMERKGISSIIKQRGSQTVRRVD